MTNVAQPRDAAEVEKAVRWAIADGKTLEVVSCGSKRGIGRAAQWDLTLDLSRLTGVTLYEPEELVLSARAGTSLAEIEALLAAKNQELAFEPMDCGPLLGRAGGAASLGGTLAANLSGPRRIKAGAARDHFLGVSAVSGRGETFKSGGRVVKNVTGYDLCKLLAGSWGTLAAMTDVTIKVLPRAETEETLLILGLTDESAARAMSAALGSPADVSGASHLPYGTAARAGVAGLRAAGRAITALRIEGVAPSVTHRRKMLQDQLNPFGEMAVLDQNNSRALWREVRDVLPFAGASEAPLWRISTAPIRGFELGAMLREQAQAEILYDWGGGLIWTQLPPSEDAGGGSVHKCVSSVGGHATLIRAPAAVRASAQVFPPQEAGLASLTRRVKKSFDPESVLNPGRMYPGV